MIYPNDIIAIVCQGIAANLTTLQTISKYLNQVGVVWYGMVWYGMVWYGMVWYGMVWYGMVWYGLVWSGMV